MFLSLWAGVLWRSPIQVQTLLNFESSQADSPRRYDSTDHVLSENYSDIFFYHLVLTHYLKPKRDFIIMGFKNRTLTSKCLWLIYLLVYWIHKHLKLHRASIHSLLCLICLLCDKDYDLLEKNKISVFSQIRLTLGLLLDLHHNCPF